MPRHPSSPETREKIRQALLGNQNALGCERSLEYRAKMSRVLKGRIFRPTNYRFPAESIEKMRAAGLRQPPHSAATREKIRQALLRHWQNPDYRKKQLAGHQTPESREQLHQARQRLPKKMTSIERILLAEFKKRRLKFEMHKSMFGQFQPDFVFEDIKLIVQADGDYWHRQRKPERDARFNEMARADGWTVWRFAETEVLMHPAACGRAVARFVRSH